MSTLQSRLAALNGTASEYLVMTSSCNSPAGKKWSGYHNLALVEVEAGASPRMISERARGVRKIIEYHYSVHVGRVRGRGVETLAALRAKAATLNWRVNA